MKIEVAVLVLADWGHAGPTWCGIVLSIMGPSPLSTEFSGVVDKDYHATALRAALLVGLEINNVDYLVGAPSGDDFVIIFQAERVRWGDNQDPKDTVHGKPTTFTWDQLAEGRYGPVFRLAEDVYNQKQLADDNYGDD